MKRADYNRPKPPTAKEKREKAAEEAMRVRVVALAADAWGFGRRGESPKSIANRVKPEMTAELASRAWWMSKVNADSPNTHWPNPDDFWRGLADECDALVEQRTREGETI